MRRSLLMCGVDSPKLVKHDSLIILPSFTVLKVFRPVNQTQLMLPGQYGHYIMTLRLSR